MHENSKETLDVQDVVFSEDNHPVFMVSMQPMGGDITRVTCLQFGLVDFAALLRSLALVADEIRLQCRKAEPDVVLPTLEELVAEIDRNNDIPF